MPAHRAGPRTGLATGPTAARDVVLVAFGVALSGQSSQAAAQVDAGAGRRGLGGTGRWPRESDG